MRQLVVGTQEAIGIRLAFKKPFSIVSAAPIAMAGHKLNMVEPIKRSRQTMIISRRFLIVDLKIMTHGF